MNTTSSPQGPCLITGANGFIGRRLCERLRAAPSAVTLRALVRKPETAGVLAGRGVELKGGDLLDASALRAALRGCHSVVHLAHDGMRGALATRALVDAAVAEGVQRFVHISSMSVHGPAPGPEAAVEATARIGRYQHDYCDSKAEQEEIVRAALDAGRLRGVILRPTVVYGAGSAFVDLVLDQARRGSLDCFDQGQGRCNPVYLDDVCDAIQAALHNEAALGQVFFINGDEDVSWGEFIRAFADLVQPGLPCKSLSSAEVLAWWAAHPPLPAPRNLPERVLRKLGRLLRPARPAPWPNKGRALRESVQVFFRNDHARQVLGWTPQTRFAAGVAATAVRLGLR